MYKVHTTLRTYERQCNKITVKIRIRHTNETIQIWNIRNKFTFHIINMSSKQFYQIKSIRKKCMLITDHLQKIYGTTGAKNQLKYPLKENSSPTKM